MSTLPKSERSYSSSQSIELSGSKLESTCEILKYTFEDGADDCSDTQTQIRYVTKYSDKLFPIDDDVYVMVEMIGRELMVKYGDWFWNKGEVFGIEDHDSYQKDEVCLQE